uniref:Flavin-containing monooxygenase n=1 Tax=Hucho hucho TaxID=62062 RepID=A0A4W5P0D3_9TELE
MVYTVAVIGAGPSGLTSIKTSGGYPGRANIYQSVIINSSKEMMSYSDFPPPAHLPNNMHHSQLLSYLRLYAQTFDLFKHIYFQVRGETQVFDAVMVCTGHFTQSHLPLNDFPGNFKFSILIIYHYLYGSAEGLQGKRVVVVGILESWPSLPKMITTFSPGLQVYLSTQKGAWVVSRVGAGGLPGDLVGTSRLDRLVQKLFPSWITRMMEKKLNRTFDHRLYGLQFFAQIPVVNDDLPGRIISGRVLVKPNIREIKGSSVVFEDGSVVEKVDVVVFATGYNYDFPFLHSGLLANGGHHLCLYHHAFPPGLTRPSLAIVGFICNLGAINPLAEITFKTPACVYPPSPSRFACLERHPLQVDHIPYMDSMAEELGVRPNLLGLLLREPGVGLRVLLGPCTP